MDLRDDVRARVVEDFVAAFHALEIILKRQLVPLQHGAHGAVSNNDPLVHGIQQLLGTGLAKYRVNIKRKTRQSDKVTCGGCYVALCV